MTKAETFLWSRLRGKQGGLKFRRQHSIGSFIVDFYCSACDVVIEIDGISHLDDKIYKRDLIKEKYLKDKGFTILRFSDNEILKNIDSILEGIKNICDDLVRDKIR